MKKIFLLFSLLVVVFSCSSEDIDEITDMEENELSPVPDIPVLGDRNKESIITYFESLISREQLVVGQQCGNTPKSTWSYYNFYVEGLARETEKYVGMIGADFGWVTENDRYSVQTLLDYWISGGLVTVSWHADNPFVDGLDVFWDTVNNKDQINLKALLKGQPETKEWMSYRNELDKVARALQELRDAGVTVIWRPFHEMNGDFFWWGANGNTNQHTNEADYKALWIDLYNTLRWDYELDNLIWTYSVVPSENIYADVTVYYPGDDYVDLVGMDYYGDQPNFPHYEDLKALGKPLVMSESGPRESGYGNWDMVELVNVLKGKAAYFLQWHSWDDADVAIRHNLNASEMMNSSEVITLDELSTVFF